MHVILDVSRLLACVWRASPFGIAPSGIDRVEMAYARRWLASPAAACTFVAESPWGRFAAVPRDRLGGLIEALEETWHGDQPTALNRARGLGMGILAGLALGAGRATLRARLAGPERCVFLLVSHRALERERGIAALRRAGAAFVPFVHDLIPLTHPEYTRPPQVHHHARRVATIVAQADAIIVNSSATAATLRPHLAIRSWDAPGRTMPSGLPPIVVAPLGIGPAPGSPHPSLRHAEAQRTGPLGQPPPTPYFVCLGTIEPRKNHLLLLHLWRDLAARPGPATPRLVLIGRRGWENENILDMLERCETLRGLVEEHGTPGDAAVAPLLAGARALLFPSFAEGYGLPLAEALALGVPAICSDLPALREVGGDVPDFLDPLDGAAWRRAVLDYAAPGSAARAAQLARLAAWQAPGWGAHFATVDALLDQVVARPKPLPMPPRQRPAPGLVPAAWRPAGFAATHPCIATPLRPTVALQPDRPLASASSPHR